MSSSSSSTRPRNQRPFSAFLSPSSRLLPPVSRSGSHGRFDPTPNHFDQLAGSHPTPDHHTSSSGDELPSYTRRPPASRPASYAGPASLLHLRSPHRIPFLHTPASAQPPSQTSNLKPHLVTSTSGKIQLTLFSTSQARFPVLLQGVDDELRGELKLNLGDFGESFSEIRVKCKGVVTTLVVRAQGNNSGNALQDETVFMQLDQSLYQPPILSASDHRLTGTVTFPFKFPLPTPSSNQSSLPPSFALTSSAPDPLASFNRYSMPSKTIEWATVKYYVKVTLARRGILRPNERLLAPFVLLSKQTLPPITSLNRLAAFNLGLPLPNPMEDPDGWMGRRVRQHIKINSHHLSRNQRSAWYEVMVLLPSPLSYARNKPLPYYLKFTSSDPTLTTEFPEDAFKVSLLQRAILTALGVSGTHENALSTGSSRSDGPHQGIHPQSSTNPHWSRRYQGDLLLGNNAVPNFTCPNISIQYYFNVTVSVPNQTADLHISLPIQLLSSPRNATPVLESSLGRVDEVAVTGTDPASSRPGFQSSHASDIHESIAPPPRAGDMPPSYLDVQEMDSQSLSLDPTT